jgi:hypothetical protein
VAPPPLPLSTRVYYDHATHGGRFFRGTRRNALGVVWVEMVCVSLCTMCVGVHASALSSVLRNVSESCVCVRVCVRDEV